MMTPENLWLFLAPLLFAPFVQEDVAVMGAAGLSVANPAFTPYIAAAIFFGLFISDIWKYWIGWLAQTRDWAAKYNSKVRVRGVGRTIRRHPGKTFMVVRFLPLVRIPAYVAAGFSRIPYIKFCFWMAVSGAVYIAIIFAIFHTLGEVAGEKAPYVLPLVGLALLLIAVSIALHQKKRFTAMAERESGPETES